MSHVRSGAADSAVDLETLNADMGASPAGFARGPATFTIGSLSIAETVRLVNTRDNGSLPSEALYVYDRRVPARTRSATVVRRSTISDGWIVRIWLL